MSTNSTDLLRGVLYIASEQEYVAEAVHSARSVRQNMPDTGIAIISDREPDADCFDTVIEMKNTQNDWGDKVYNMHRSPFERTIFLDGDIFVDSDISEMFDLLDRFDIAAAHAPNRELEPVAGIPRSFPEYNTGVVAFSDTPAVDAFFSRWRQVYEQDIERDVAVDQPSFRKALYECDLRIATLTPEYNCRFVFPEAVDQTIKVFHGRHENLGDLARRLNATSERRVFWEKRGKIRVRTKNRGVIAHLRRSIRQDGVMKTAQKTIERISRTVLRSD